MRACRQGGAKQPPACLAPSRSAVKLPVNQSSSREFYIPALLTLGFILSWWILRPADNPLFFHATGDGVLLVERDARTQHASLMAFKSIWTEGYWWAQVNPLYRPMTTTSFLLGNEVAGKFEVSPSSAQTAMNLLLHALNAWLAFTVLRAMTRATALAALAVLLWALFPGNAEAVVGIAGRADLLALSFGLTSLRLALSNRIGWGMLFAAFAALSKENGCVFFAMPVLVSLMRGERPPVRVWVGVAVGAMLTVGVQVWRHHLAAGYFIPFTDNPLTYFSGFRRSLAGAGTLVTGTLQWLTQGGSFHDGSFAEPFVVDRFLSVGLEKFWLICDLLCWLLLIGASGLSLYKLFRAPQPSPFGWLWFFATVIPASSVVVPIGTAWGDRLMYAPSIGLFLVLASLACDFFKRTMELSPARILPFGFVAVFAFILLFEAGVWLSKTSLWSSEVYLVRATQQSSPHSLRHQLSWCRIRWDAEPQTTELITTLIRQVDEIVRVQRSVKIEPWQRDYESLLFLGDLHLAWSKSNPAALRLAELAWREALEVQSAIEEHGDALARGSPRTVSLAGNDTPRARLVSLLIQQQRWTEVASLVFRQRFAAPTDPLVCHQMAQMFSAVGLNHEGAVAELQSQILEGKRISFSRVPVGIIRAALGDLIDVFIRCRLTDRARRLQDLLAALPAT